MNLQLIGNALLILLLVGFIGFRQMQWRPISVGRMWRMPILFALIGVVIVSTQTKGAKITTLDLAVLAVELVVALGVGAAMGAIAQFRPMPRTADPTAPEFQSRTGWLGMALWVVMIGVRVGIDFWANAQGATFAASTGIILIMLAANRAARTAVFASRVAKLDSLAVTHR